MQVTLYTENCHVSNLGGKNTDDGTGESLTWWSGRLGNWQPGKLANGLTSKLGFTDCPSRNYDRWSLKCKGAQAGLDQGK